MIIIIIINFVTVYLCIYFFLLVYKKFQFFYISLIVITYWV